MKKLVYGAAALTLAGTAFASDTDWSAFNQDVAYNQDVQSLATSLAAEKEGPSIGGFLQTLYSLDSDNDISSFSILRARIEVTGGREGYAYKVGYETSTNQLLDAYFVIPVSSISAKFGRFRPAVVRGGLVSNSQRFFIDRSALGAAFEGRQDGIQLSGDFDQLSWWASITNGQDDFAAAANNGGDTDDYLFAVRVALDLVGGGINDGVEGAYGGPDEIGAQVAVSFYDDGVFDDGDGFVVEGHVVSSVYSFGFEFADLSDQGASASTATTAGPSTSLPLGNDTTPFTLYGTYMLTPDQWEVGVRFQDTDDAFDSTSVDIGVVNYLDGHNLKWGFGFRTTDSDAEVLDTEIFQFQLSMRF